MADASKPGTKPRGKHPHQALTPMKINALKEAGLYADGMGLYLRVERNGAKRWIQRVTINGKRTDLGLGGYPLVTLAEARSTALENKRLIRSGKDPRKNRNAPTFQAAAKAVHELHQPGWKNPKHAKQWISSLEQYAFPLIGDKRVDAISTADVLNILIPIWTDKPETAKRVLQRMGVILKWSMAQGWRTDNPTEAVAQALPKHDGAKKQHHKSLPYEQVADAIQRVKESSAYPTTKLAFEFLVLTAARSGEVRGARWEEIDGDTWTIPAERMKTKKTHRVPLPHRCLEILDEARAFDNGSRLVFPSTRGREMSDNTLSKLLRELGIEAVPHGFRSSFRVWASEQTSIPHQVCEFALSHVIGNKAEAAYQRSDLFEKRRHLMEMWATYLEHSANSGKVVSLTKKAR